MSICLNVTEHDLINLAKLAEQQKYQRAQKIKSKILKQTEDRKISRKLWTYNYKTNRSEWFY